MWYNKITYPLFIMMIVTLSSVNTGGLDKSKAIPYFASITYAFYLAQFYVWKISQKVLVSLGVDGNLCRMLVSLVVCIIIAAILHALIEKPASKYLKKMLIK